MTLDYLLRAHLASSYWKVLKRRMWNYFNTLMDFTLSQTYFSYIFFLLPVLGVCGFLDIVPSEIWERRWGGEGELCCFVITTSHLVSIYRRKLKKMQVSFTGEATQSLTHFLLFWKSVCMSFTTRIWRKACIFFIFWCSKHYCIALCGNVVSRINVV